MITSTACITKYRELFPEDGCAFSEPGPGVFILMHSSGKCLISPFFETNDEFIDRLERCKAENRNLFYEEWSEFSCEDGKIY